MKIENGVEAAVIQQALAFYLQHQRRYEKGKESTILGDTAASLLERALGMRAGDAANARTLAQRYSVRFRVSLPSHGDTKYRALNLSAGGLFVGGAIALRRGDLIDLDLDLPGRGRHIVKGTVTHLIDQDIAAERGLPAGAGVQLLLEESDAASRQAIESYLSLVDKRGLASLWVDRLGTLPELLLAVGYDVHAIPPLARGQEPALASGIRAALLSPTDPRREIISDLANGPILVDVEPHSSFDDILQLVDSLLD